MKTGYVYILANQRNGTLYVGVTSDLVKRIHQHKDEHVDGFTKKHGLHTLVYYERVEDIRAALQREKTIKKYSRKWKLNLIEETNPEWRDLYDDIV
jgi:putative endonuclease